MVEIVIAVCKIVGPLSTLCVAAILLLIALGKIEV
jgi:hypothetical protein